MKVVFCNQLTEMLGVQILSACLKQAGHDAEVVFEPNLFATGAIKDPKLVSMLSNDGLVIDGKAERVDTNAAQGSGDFAVGGRIFHQKFGYGLILSVSGNRLEISFDKAGTKKVIDQFVEPT